MQKIEITIPDYRAVSWNKLYAGQHWSKRTEMKLLAKALVREQLDPNQQPFQEPVDISIIAVYKHHPVDSDNVCDKILIDALKDFVIVDDDIAYVRRVCTEARIGMSDFVIIRVSPTKEKGK